MSDDIVDSYKLTVPTGYYTWNQSVMWHRKSLAHQPQTVSDDIVATADLDNLLRTSRYAAATANIPLIDETPEEVLRDHLEYAQKTLDRAIESRTELQVTLDKLGQAIEGVVSEIDKIKIAIEAVVEAAKPRKYL